VSDAMIFGLRKGNDFLPYIIYKLSHIIFLVQVYWYIYKQYVTIELKQCVQ